MDLSIMSVIAKGFTVGMYVTSANYSTVSIMSTYHFVCKDFCHATC